MDDALKQYFDLKTIFLESSSTTPTSGALQIEQNFDKNRLRAKSLSGYVTTSTFFILVKVLKTLVRECPHGKWSVAGKTKNRKTV